MKALLLSILMTFLLQGPQAQTPQNNTLLQQARLEYRKKHFLRTQLLLDSAEKTSGISPDLLHLKILNQRALLPATTDPRFYQDMKQFEKLEDLRENCISFQSHYPQAPAKQQAEVRSVQESLKEYPVAKVQFDENRHLQRTRQVRDQ